MKRIIQTPDAPAAVGPYSQAVEYDGMLFVSGQVPLDPATGKIVHGGIREQTARVLHNIRAILNKAGYKPCDVIKCTCLLSDMEDFRAMNEEYASFFPDDPPARAAFAVKELPLGALVEIECIAAKKNRRADPGG